jgi:hypothetical protein
MTIATLGSILILMGIVVLTTALALPLVYALRERNALSRARSAAERA